MHSKLHHSRFLSQKMLLESDFQVHRECYRMFPKTRSCLELESDDSSGVCHVVGVFFFAGHFSTLNHFFDSHPGTCNTCHMQQPQSVLPEVSSQCSHSINGQVLYHSCQQRPTETAWSTNLSGFVADHTTTYTCHQKCGLNRARSSLSPLGRGEPGEPHASHAC